MEQIGFPGVSISTPEIDNLERSVTNAVNRITDRADNQNLLKKLSEITDMDELLAYEETFRAYLLRYLEKNCARLGLPEMTDPLSEDLLNALEALDADLNWAGYFQKGTVPRKREKVIQLGFALKMGYRDVLELLMLCNKEPLSVRNAFDYICLIFLRSTLRDHYTWYDVQTVYADFLENRQQDTFTIAQDTPADTLSLMDTARKFYAGPEVEKATLLTFMTEHSACFYLFQQRNRHKYGKTDLRKEFAQLHLSYTRTRADWYLRLMKYLRTLYGVNQTGVAEVFKACYQRMNWIESGIYGMLENEYQLPLSTPAHIRAVSRFYEAAKSPEFLYQEDHKNIDFFTRNDVLLMIFFLLQGFCQLSRKNTVFFSQEELSSIPESIEKLFQSGDELDRHIEYAYGAIRRIYTDSSADYHTHAQVREKNLSYLMKCMDQLLRVMGYHGLYPLALMDRFCLLNLVNPDLTGTKVLFLDSDGICDSQAAHICMQAMLSAGNRGILPTAAAGLQTEENKILYRSKRENLRNDISQVLLDKYSGYQEKMLPFFTGAVQRDAASIVYYPRIVCMEQSVKEALEKQLEKYLRDAYPTDWKDRLRVQMQKCTVFLKKPDYAYRYNKETKCSPFGTWIVTGCEEILDQLTKADIRKGTVAE